MLSRKSKSISVRISDHEYREIKERCNDTGDLSVSEFIRAAMVRALGSADAGVDSMLETRLAQVRRRLHSLETRMNDLEQHVGRGVDGTC